MHHCCFSHGLSSFFLTLAAPFPVKCFQRRATPPACPLTVAGSSAGVPPALANTPRQAIGLLSARQTSRAPAGSAACDTVRRGVLLPPRLAASAPRAHDSPLSSDRFPRPSAWFPAPRRLAAECGHVSGSALHDVLSTPAFPVPGALLDLMSLDIAWQASLTFRLMRDICAFVCFIWVAATHHRYIPLLIVSFVFNENKRFLGVHPLARPGVLFFLT